MRSIYTFTTQFSVGNIKIELLVPDKQCLNPNDYWGKIWPSSIALSRFLVKHIHLCQQKIVLELASGLGLAGFIAAHFAKRVVLSDYIPEAVFVMKATAQKYNYTNVACRQIDWTAIPKDVETPEVLLLSDINYAPEDFEILYAVLTSFLRNGTTIVLATPQRLMAKPFITQLLPYCIDQAEEEVVTADEQAFISIFVLKII